MARKTEEIYLSEQEIKMAIREFCVNNNLTEEHLNLDDIRITTGNGSGGVHYNAMVIVGKVIDTTSEETKNV